MRITIDIYKSVQANAAYYYERAKRSNKKIEGAQRAYEETLKKIENLSAKKEQRQKRQGFIVKPILKSNIKTL